MRPPGTKTSLVSPSHSNLTIQPTTPAESTSSAQSSAPVSCRRWRYGAYSKRRTVSGSSAREITWDRPGMTPKLGRVEFKKIHQSPASLAITGDTAKKESCGPTVRRKQATVSQARGRFPVDAKGRLLTGRPGAFPRQAFSDSDAQVSGHQWPDVVFKLIDRRERGACLQETSRKPECAFGIPRPHHGGSGFRREADEGGGQD